MIKAGVTASEAKQSHWKNEIASPHFVGFAMTFSSIPFLSRIDVK